MWTTIEDGRFPYSRGKINIFSKLVLKKFTNQIFQSILDLKSLDFRISYAYYQNQNSLEEAHRTKVAKSLVYEILEKDPDKK